MRSTWSIAKYAHGNAQGRRDTRPRIQTCKKWASSLILSSTQPPRLCLCKRNLGGFSFSGAEYAWLR